jgi:hypothetical protein
MGKEKGKAVKKSEPATPPPSAPPPAPAKQKTVEEKVNDWLAQHGYHLEYKTYKALRKAGIPALMSTFLGGDEEMPREIDVIGELHEQGGVPAAVNVVCECKYSNKGHPWVLLQSESRSSFSIEWHALPQTESVKNLWKFTKTCQHDFEQTWHFVRNAAFGHSLVEALKEGNADVAYGAVQKISHAAWDYTAKPVPRGEFGPKDGTDYRVVIPCIVVDSPLLMAKFNHEKGEFETTHIPFGRLFWQGVHNGTIIDVVQKDSLAVYAKKLFQTMNRIQELLFVAPERIRYMNV